MKKSGLIILLSSVLAIGVTSFAVSLNKNNVEVEATPNNEMQLFVQVRDESDLTDGDEVIITSNDRTMLGVGANPVYLAATGIDGFNNDYSKYYLSNTDAIKMLVEWHEGGTYSFKSLKTPTEEKDRSLKTSGKYLSYAVQIDGYRYTEDGCQRGTYGDLIFRSALDEYSKMIVDFDDKGFAYISRENEANRYGVVDNPISVKYRNIYNPSGFGLFGYYDGGSNIRIYRKVDLSQGVDIVVTKNGDKTSFLPNEAVDLTGLEINVTFNDKQALSSYTCTYENEPNLFKALTADYDTQQARFEWCGFPSYYQANVSVPIENEHYYTRVTDFGPKDDRGTYLLGFNNLEGEIGSFVNHTYVLNLSSIPVGVNNAEAATLVSLGNNRDHICDKNNLNQYITDITNNLFEIVYEGDGYYVKTSDKYLCVKDTGYTYKLLYLGNKTEATPVRIGLNGYLETVLNDTFSVAVNDNNRVYVNTSDYEGSDVKMTLYKLDIPEELPLTVTNFMDSFYEKTVNFDPSSNTPNINTDDWNNLSAAFNNFDVDYQGYLASVTYKHNAETNPSLKDMMDRYDYIVRKYSFDDFMARGAAGTLENYVAIETIESLNTLAALKYNYEKVGDTYTYSDVSIRFGGLISKANWDALNEFEIEEYGVIYTTAEQLDGQTIEQKYNSYKTDDRSINQALSLFIDEENYKRARVTIDLFNTKPPAIATDAQKALMGEDINQVYYTWTLRKGVGENYTKFYNAVAYLKTSDKMVFFNEASESAKHLAAISLARTSVDDPAYESLEYFVNN